MEGNTVGAGEYLELLEQNDQNLVDLLSKEFDTIGRDSKTLCAVTETWILSVEQIQQQDILVGELLSLMNKLG